MQTSRVIHHLHIQYILIILDQVKRKKKSHQDVE